MELRIRPAGEPDAVEVADIYLASVKAALPYLRRPHTDDDVREWVASVLVPAGGVVVAVDAEDPSGHAVVGFASVQDGSLDQLYVRPDALRKGVGSALLAEARARCPEGLRLFVFQRNAAARAFYRAHGFQVVAFSDGAANEEQEPDLVMTWEPGTARRDPSE